MKNYRINIVRHAKTENNINLKLCGSLDIEVSNEGVEELLKLKEMFHYPKVSKVYTSPLIRCRKTAEILYPDSYTEVVNDLSEFCFGDFEGKTYLELQDKEDFRKWMAGENDFSFPNGESNADFSLRCKDAFEYIFTDMMNNNITDVAVITHGGVIMNTLCMFGYPKKPMRDWLVENGRGYTLMATPAMWMRDRGFEVFDVIPKLSDN